MRDKWIVLVTVGLVLYLLAACAQGKVQNSDELTGVSQPDSQASPTENTSKNGTPIPLTQGAREPVMKDKPSQPASFDSAIQAIAEQAIDDLTVRLGIPQEEINLLEVRQVTWPDSSLGCPQAGMVYTQVPQEGLLIRLGVERDMYFYHSGKTQIPFLCEETSQVLPKITQKSDEFVPPPDSEID